MKRLFFVLAIFASLVLGLFGCAPQQTAVRAVTVRTQEQEIDLSVAMTAGNYTYIPLNLDGDASGHAPEVLAVLNAFEKAHSDWEVTSWSIEEAHGGFSAPPFLWGIWINHRLRK